MVQALDAERFHLAPPLNQIRVGGHSAEDKWFLPLLHLLNAGSGSRQAKIVINPDGLVESTDGLETLMIIGKPAPFVSAFVAAVDEAIRAHQPSRGMSAMQRTW